MGEVEQLARNGLDLLHFHTCFLDFIIGKYKELRAVE